MKQMKWMALGWLVLSCAAHSASFDCAKAQSPQEVLVCFDYRLSDLDSQLAWTYTEALKSAGDMEAIKQGQKDWLAKREQCQDIKCIMHAYIDRIAALSPGTNLEDLYFPKEDRPWEYLPKLGYDVGPVPHLKGNNLNFTTYLKGTMTHGKDLVIPLGVSEDQIKDGNGGKPTYMAGRLSIVAQNPIVPKPVAESGRMVHLGGMRIAKVGIGYMECSGRVNESGIYVERKLPWAQDSMLVAIREKSWAPERHRGTFTEPDCDGSIALRLLPGHMEATVLNDTLYLYEESGGPLIYPDNVVGKFVLRMNRNLQTGSSLLGRKIFLSWGTDVNNLTKTACDSLLVLDIGGRLTGYTAKYLACIDGQLQKIIKAVSPFYNRGE